MENHGKPRRGKSLSEIDEKVDLFAAVFVGCLIVLTLVLLLVGCAPSRGYQHAVSEDEPTPGRAWSSPVFQNGNQIYDLHGNQAWISNGGMSTTQGGTVWTLPNGQRSFQDRSGRVHPLPK